MFSRADELELYFNETVLDVFKDFDAGWMRFKRVGWGFRTCPLLSESTNVISR